MRKQLHIIYIPGFGEIYDAGRRTLLNSWRIFGATTEFVPMNWNNTETYEQKLQRVHLAIDKAAGKRIVLIGESAGGSIALPIYATRRHELHKVMTICGKNSRAANVAPRLYRKHIAFAAAMRHTDTVVGRLDKKQLRHLVVFYPLFDEIIPYNETALPGSRVIRLVSVGHFLTILLSLTLFSGYIVRVARS
jgi:hypothetical protein